EIEKEWLLRTFKVSRIEIRNGITLVNFLKLLKLELEISNTA
ncbi:14092_t:CDS:2, partial [Funneliformis caledonium]